jgi:hypothetical protein
MINQKFISKFVNGRKTLHENLDLLLDLIEEAREEELLCATDSINKHADLLKIYLKILIEKEEPKNA